LSGEIRTSPGILCKGDGDILGQKGAKSWASLILKRRGEQAHYHLLPVLS
jgi:hypothetical protein